MRPQALISGFLVNVLFFGFTCFGEALAEAEHNKYFKCKHTQNKIERGKDCPCGCNKLKKPGPRIISEISDCEADEIVIHVPQFSKFNAMIADYGRLHPILFSERILDFTNFPHGQIILPETPPA